MVEGIDVEKAQGALEAAVVSTLAEMTFVDISRAAGEVPAQADEVCAVIDVLKPLSVQIQVFFPAALRERIIQTLFSGDWEESPDKDDSVLELLNVIAGSFLSNYFGQGVHYKLQLPQFLYTEDEGFPLFTLNLDAEGVPFRVALRSVRYTY